MGAGLGKNANTRTTMWFGEAIHTRTARIGREETVPLGPSVEEVEVLYPNYYMLCIICHYAGVYYKDTTTCAKCGVCQWCGTSPAIDIESRRCAACRCQDCGAITKDLKIMPAAKELTLPWNGGNLCPECLFKRFPDRICRKCKKTESRYGWRGNLKKATLCEACAFPGNPKTGLAGKPLLCTWCNNPAPRLRKTGTGISFLSCIEHERNISCFRGSCNPQDQCQVCLAQARATDEQRHDLADKTLFIRQSVPPIFYAADSMKLRRKNRSDRFIGSELELSGIGLVENGLVEGARHKKTHDCQCVLCYDLRKMEIRKVAEKWGMGIMRDGSLPREGFEVITSPAAGDLWLDQVQEICTVLRRCVECRESNRPTCTRAAYVTEACGLHVHIDARDFAYADIRKLIMLYAPIEGVLLRTQPSGRILVGYGGHQFSRPCAKKYLASIDDIKIDDDPKLWYKAAKKALNAGVYGATYSEKAPKSDRYNDARYNFMNLHSWYINGTVECRGHSGTIKASNITVWGMVWANILDSAYAMTEKDILGLTKNSGKTPQEILLEVATRNSTVRAKQAIERYLRLRWREFESGYERSEY